MKLFQVMELQVIEATHASVLSDRNGQISTLQFEMQKLGEITTEKDQALILKDAELTGLRSTVESLQLISSEQAAEISSLKVDLSKLEGKRASLQTRLSDESSNSDTLSKKLGEVEATNVALWEQLTAMVQDNARLHAASTEARTSLVKMTARIGLLDDVMVCAKSTERQLRESLCDQESQSNALRDELISRTAELQAVDLSLKGLQSTVEKLNADLSTSRERCETLARASTVREGTVAQLVASNEELQTKLSALSHDNLSFTEQLRDTRLILDETNIRCQRSDEKIVSMTQDNLAKVKETEALTTECSKAEARANHLAGQVDESQKIIEGLEVDKAAALARIQNLRDNLEQSRSELVAQNSAHNAVVSSLETTLSRLKGEVTATNAELVSMKVARDDLARYVQSSDRSLEQAKIALETETARVSALERTVAEVMGRAQTAQELVAELEQSKAADESTIENLKSGFTRLRQVHIESFAELDTKVCLSHQALERALARS